MARARTSFWLTLALSLGPSCGPADDNTERGDDTHDQQVDPAQEPAGDAAARDASYGAAQDAGTEDALPEPGHMDAAANDAGESGDAASPLDATTGPVDAGGEDAGAMEQPLPPALRDAGVVSLFPARASRDQCVDAPLRIAFDGVPSLGSAGKVRVYDAASPTTPVATVDLAVTRVTDTRGGVTFTMPRPAYVDDNAVVFYLPSGALRGGRSYFVRIDAGAVRGPRGQALSIADDETWTFHISPSAPRGRTLKVARDGTGDYCALQAAVDAAGEGTSIEIARGTYHGIVYFKGKRDVTIRGADRKATVLAGTNNENMNGGTAKRALIGVDASSGITFENLTIHNLTPQGGSQAEALRMQNCDRCVVRDADIISLQDTLLWSGRIYAKNCYIAGNVDFIWGTGTAYFDRCEIKTLGRKGYTVQARNGASGYGYVFVDSKLTSDPGITGHLLARVDSSVYPASHVAYIDCEMGRHIDPVGWQVTGGGTGSIRFWEYRSRDPSGALVDVSRRLRGSRQLSAAEAARMRDPRVVLGGWSPE